MGSIYRVEMLGKGMVQVPGRMEWDSGKFHHITQIGVQYKLMNYFRNFYLIVSDRG